MKISRFAATYAGVEALQRSESINLKPQPTYTTIKIKERIIMRKSCVSEGQDNN